ncbi:MAG: ABC transporter ATP-binding protein [Acidobacteriota bacterium]
MAESKGRNENFHEEDDVGKVYDSRLMRRLLGYVAPYRGRAVGAVALILFSSALQLVGPLATAVALDLFIRPMENRETHATVSRWVDGWLTAGGVVMDPITGLAATVAVFTAALVLTFAVLFLQGYIMQMLGQLIMFDLRRQVFAKLQRLSVAYLDRHPVGRLVTRATTDIASLNELFTAGLVSIFGDIGLLVGIAAVLFLLNWKLALVSFAILPLLLGLSVWFKTRARQSFRRVRVKIARIGAFLQEHITGMSIVQLFGRGDAAKREFSDINADHRDANIRAIFYYAVYYPAVELITAIGLALIVWYGGGEVLQNTLSLGALVAFLQFARRFYQPLADLSEKYNILQAAMASSERIFQLLDAEIDVTSPAQCYRPDTVQGEIELQDVTFSYKPGEPVLENVSFRVAAGETVAIVGHTGAGKSTLVNLLQRFYDIDSGRILIDGVDIRQWDLDVMRRAFAMVLQDVFLFSGDVQGNIRLGDTSITDAQLRQAAEEVHALDFIEQLPDGFATEVRERGAGLSVGQKQLIAFARALAFDPRIMILDEATSSIDTETEQHIQKALDRLLVGRTSVVIAHRLSTIQRADRILVLHKGRLREQGSHQELLAARGIYHTLYQLQFQGQREALVSV